VSDTPPVIDRPTFDSLVQMTGGDLAFVDDLVDTFLTDGEQQLAELRAASAAGSIADLVRPAHSMKSSSLSLGAVELGGRCRALEEAAGAGAVDDPGAMVEAIAASFAAAREALLAERGGRPQG
jgi:HPt (histidine-containing phosphotransfer) domain-containing protein